MQRGRLPYILIPLTAFLATLPLILHGPSCGHDFDFHLVSWFEAAKQFQHGNFHPTWAFTPAWDAGEPRFVFYPPASWMLGAILGLILPWTWTPIAYTWLALTAAGLSLYRLARDFTTSGAATLAAILYLANPYTLFTAYERTAYAELLAAAIIPLLLRGILRPKITIPGIAIPVALLWLTNAPAAVMGCYTLALLTLIRLAISPGAPHLASEMWASSKARPSSLQLALTSTAGTLLGLGLAAFYILPAAYERRYVQIAMAILPGMAIHDNFLFHHTGTTPDAIDHDTVLRTASIIAVVLITLTALALARFATTLGVPSSRSLTALGRPSSEARPSSADSPKNLLLPLTILTLTIAFLLTPPSTPIWSHAPELLFLQFPWRFLAIQAAVFALAVALALRAISLKPNALAILGTALAAALIYPAYADFAQQCDTPDTPLARLTLFHSPNPGTDPTDEYTPTAADNDSLKQANPPYWLSANPNAPASTNSKPGAVLSTFSFNAPTRETLILNLRNYPAWNVTRTGPDTLSLEHSPLIPRTDGLIAFVVPAGPSTIVITHKTLPDQIIGSAISLISLILLTLCIWHPSFIIKV